MHEHTKGGVLVRLHPTSTPSHSNTLSGWQDWHTRWVRVHSSGTPGPLLVGVTDVVSTVDSMPIQCTEIDLFRMQLACPTTQPSTRSLGVSQRTLASRAHSFKALGSAASIHSLQHSRVSYSQEPSRGDSSTRTWRFLFARTLAICKLYMSSSPRHARQFQMHRVCCD